MSGSPASWPLVKIGDIARVKAGATPSREKKELYFSESGHPWVKTGDLTDGLLYETAERITEKAIADTSCEIHPPGTVLVAMYGGFQQIGRTGILQMHAATNQAVSAILANRQRVLPRFLNYCFVYSRPAWKKIAASSRKDPNITKQDILDFQIPLPPLSEQRRIAEILSSVDEAIAVTQAVIEQTRTVKQSVLNHLLSKGIRHTRFKQTEIGVLPETWKVVCVSDILTDSRYGLNTPLTSEPLGVPVLRMGNIVDHALDFGSLKYAELTKADAEKYSIRRGDILFNRTNSRELVGKLAVVNEKIDASFASYIIRLRTDHTQSDPWFLHAILSSPTYQDYLRSIATPGASQANINANKLGKVMVPLPPVAEQILIVANLKSFDEAVSASTARMSALQRIKFALMADLLTGRKRVTADALSPAV